MKRILFLLCLIPSMLINGQIIDYNHFNEKTLNDAMYNSLNNVKHRSRVYSSNKKKQIYEYVKNNCEKISIDSLVLKININIVVDFVVIIDHFSCDSIKTYQGIVNKCNSDWSNADDKFFRDLWGTKIFVVSYYDKKTNMIYVISAFKQESARMLLFAAPVELIVDRHSVQKVAEHFVRPSVEKR